MGAEHKRTPKICKHHHQPLLTGMGAEQWGGVTAPRQQRGRDEKGRGREEDTVLSRLPSWVRSCSGITKLGWL